MRTSVDPQFFSTSRVGEFPSPFRDPPGNGAAHGDIATAGAAELQQRAARLRARGTLAAVLAALRSREGTEVAALRVARRDVGRPIWHPTTGKPMGFPWFS